jgi:hypothetical protein
MMSVDPKKIVAWVGLPAAFVGAVLLFGEKWDGFQAKTELLAQEAARVEAREVVTEQMAPAVEQLELIKESLRRQEDRELLDRCEIRAERRGEDPLDYEPWCIEESNLRWLWWDYDDCLAEGREDCQEPVRPRP